MAAIGQNSSPGLRLSVIVPFHKDLARLQPCLEAIRAAASALPSAAHLAEIIVAADGAVENPEPVARQTGARVLAIAGPKGPAVARTRAAEQASGNLLVFVDSDVVVRPDALARLAALFLADATIGAAFGAYDEEPAERGFFSQCKNLAHSFIHQRSNRDATTFWAGLGAVRASVFAHVGGFDPRFVQPSVEDIDLGYRIRAAGYRIVLEPAIQGTHLKRWTFWSSIVTDVRDRGVPWTQLLNRYRSMRNDLNLTFKYRLAVVMSYALVVALVAAPWWPPLLLAALGLVVGLWMIDRPYYRFFASRRGWPFALAWFPFHILHHLCNGVSFAIGTCLYAGRRWAGVALPWALPVTPWSPREMR
jgi:glycosyltransferase involved in cell wall biosynthesis